MTTNISDDLHRREGCGFQNRFPHRRRDSYRCRQAGLWRDEILENSAFADAEGASGPTAISQAKGQNVHTEHLLAGIWQVFGLSEFYLIGALLVGVPTFSFFRYVKIFTFKEREYGKFC